jgi:hypothetical protein
MRFSTTTKAALVGITFVAGTNAFWRMECRARSGLARIDPLVSPGTVSEHNHAIHGGSAFSSTATTESLLASDCTSCSVSQDKSAYWTPPLYFKDASTGEFEVVEQVGGMLAYYLLYNNSFGDTNLYAFPTGFSMIAGETNLRNFSDYAVPDLPKSDWTGEYTTQAFLGQAALGFNCLNYAASPEGSLYRHFLPDKAYLDANCKDGVRFELMFPSCWNGETNAADQKSHVAYPSEVMTGTCPDSHPKRLVSLFYETIWNTAAYVGRDGEFVIANGDPTGYGYHGDFMMGWDETLLTNAVGQCTNPSGLISDCPLFDIQDASVYGNCDITLPTELVSEKVIGPISSLPGNVPIASGPGPADGATAGGSDATPVVVPTLSHSDGVVLPTSATYVPGAVFAVSESEEVKVASETPTPSTTSTSSTTPVVVPATTPAPSPIDTQSYFSTEYSTSGFTVNEVLWVEEVQTVTVPVTETATTTLVNKRHVHKHKRARGF